ncbi:hypothetical protein BDV98DRAFT_580319 [Pterulicium gracile]|uniref:Uncharacterized protein n=1 Tax=Pterulicium gracile TaxID=1884261 RepID=A0A5C3QT75_9AGAR|nr:hypothetical protein BDV98DRAFT_580319 [Pterula gracilis]
MARAQELSQALQESPGLAHIAVITGEPGQVTQPSQDTPGTQQERWVILENHFWRYVYGMSASLMLQEFINVGLAALGVEPTGAQKYIGKLWHTKMDGSHATRESRSFRERREEPPVGWGTSNSPST